MVQYVKWPFKMQNAGTFQVETFVCDHIPSHVPVYAFCLIPAILHNDLWVKAEPTQPRCGADLTHAVSLIADPLLNTNVHLLWLHRLNRCLVSIHSQILWSLVSAVFNPCFPFRHNIREEGIVSPQSCIYFLCSE